MQPSAADVEPRLAHAGRRRRRDPSPTRSVCETDAEGLTSAISDSESSDDLEPPHQQMVPRARRRLGPRRRRIAAAEDVAAALQLARQVNEMRQRHDELMALHVARMLNSGRRDAALNTTVEYFDTFRDGFTGPRLPDMLRFFSNRLDRDVFVYGNTDMGLDTWIEQWRRYTHLFPSIQIRLRGTTFTQLLESQAEMQLARVDPSMTTTMVETQSFMSGILSRQAIYTVLPHLRDREDLVLKLLGKHFECPTTLRFYFNSSGRVHRLDFDVDYFRAFSNIEGIGLMDLAQITQHLAVGDNSTVPDIVELEDGNEEST